MNTHEMYKRLRCKKSELLSHIKESDGEYIYNFLRTHRLHKTIEIGFACGYSAAYIMLATKHTHLVIDPRESQYDNVGLKNIKALKLDKHLVFINDYSHNALPQLHSAGKTFNFAFIDGGHKFDEIFLDFYYIDMLLDQKGYVLFHDQWLQSTQHVVSWILHNKRNYQLITVPEKNLVLFQKNGIYKREWHHFCDFCPSPEKTTRIYQITNIVSFIRNKVARLTKIVA